MSCLFCRVVAGEIPAKVVWQDERALAFRDINPQAPTHVLVIPRRHIASLNDVGPEDVDLLGHLLGAARTIAAAEGRAESGWRAVVNVNGDGGQTVFHLHVHILAGRQMEWPPG